MNLKNQLESELKNTSSNYIPLKVQLQMNKKLFAIERKIQKLLKEKKKYVCKAEFIPNARNIAITIFVTFFQTLTFILCER